MMFPSRRAALYLEVTPGTLAAAAFVVEEESADADATTDEPRRDKAKPHRAPPNPARVTRITESRIAKSCASLFGGGALTACGGEEAIVSSSSSSSLVVVGFGRL